MQNRTLLTTYIFITTILFCSFSLSAEQNPQSKVKHLLPKKDISLVIHNARFTCDSGYVDDCADDDCCPETWIGDGYGDCEDQAYGCDLTCYDSDGGDCTAGNDGGDTGGSETCSDCELDWTSYGSECCDTAWDEYGINCTNLEGNYGWDCSGCACPGDEPTCEDQGFWDCGDGQCIPPSYVCDGSSEFCNAGWDADCANGADEGLEFCGYEDECNASTNGPLQSIINTAECGAELSIAAGDYDESIVIHKCIKIVVADDNEGRGKIRVMRGTDIDLNERDNENCGCDYVILDGFEFYGESSDESVISVNPTGGNLLVGSLQINNSIFDGGLHRNGLSGSNINELIITESSFQNSLTAVSITGGSVANHHINESWFFLTNSTNIFNPNTEGQFDATNNWWGSEDGPGDPPNDFVNTNYWYVDESMTNTMCWEFNPLNGQMEWVSCGDGWDIDIPGCMDPNACNFLHEATIDDGSCANINPNTVMCNGAGNSYSGTLGCDCFGDCVCSDDGGCPANYPWDMYNGQLPVEDCDGECGGSANIDECGVCNGSGAIYECGCENLAEDACNCDGNVLDECGECGGDGLSCLQGMIDATECGEILYVPDGEYDESITINKCMSLIPENRGMIKVMRGTDIDLNEREDCWCFDVTLEGIDFFADVDSSSSALSVSSPMGLLTLSNSIIDGRGAYGFSGADIEELIVTGSTFQFSNTAVSINCTQDEGGSVANHHINESSFLSNNNNINVSSQCEGTLDATNNWWGSADGPGESVEGNVNTGSWYTDETMNETVTQDCAGIWDGNAEIDECDECGGDDNNGDGACNCTIDSDCSNLPGDQYCSSQEYCVEYSNGYCASNDCGEGDGDCDSSAECSEGLYCGQNLNNCGFTFNSDADCCCMPDTDECCSTDNCGICDDDPNNDCEADECGEWGGPGIPEGECDCDGNVADICGVCDGDGTYCNSFLQNAINEAECGAELSIPADEYDESIVIHKCITIQVADEGRGRIRVMRGTDIDLNERDNSACECDDVILDGFEFYGEDSDASVISVNPGAETYLVGSLQITNSNLNGMNNSEGQYALIASNVENLYISASAITNSTGISIIGGSVDGHVISENLFEENIHNMDVNNDCSGTLNAELNWWGSTEGPPAGTITGSVDYEPWAINEWWMTELPGEDCWLSGDEFFDCNQLDFGSGSDECSCTDITGAEMDWNGNCYCPEGTTYGPSPCYTDDCFGNDYSEDCGACNLDGIIVDVEGCMDDSACDYNPDATIDNDSCLYPEDLGWCDCAGNVEDCAGECGGSAEIVCDICGGEYGDVDNDNVIDVTDIIALIQNILYPSENICLGDMNADGTINVIDVLEIISIILEGGLTRGQGANKASIYFGNGSVSYESDGDIAGLQLMVSGDYTISESYLPAGWELSFSPSVIILYSMDGSSLKEKMLFKYEGEITIESSIVADWYESDVSISNIMLPEEFALMPAYPNPFNPITSVELAMPHDGFVSVKVYNIMGQVVATLHEGMLTAKTYAFTWNASDMSSGIYFLKAETAGRVDFQKIMLMK